MYLNKKEKMALHAIIELIKTLPEDTSSPEEREKMVRGVKSILKKGKKERLRRQEARADRKAKELERSMLPKYESGDGVKYGDLEGFIRKMTTQYVHVKFTNDKSKPDGISFEKFYYHPINESQLSIKLISPTEE